MDKNQYTEIDLLKLLTEIPSSIRRHLGWFVGTAATGIFLAGLFYVFFPKQYELTILGESQVIKAEALAEMARALNSSSRDNNFEDLSRQLNLSESIVSTIAKIKVTEIKPDILVSTSTPRENYFELVITVRSTVYADSLANAFLNFFEGNEIVSQRKQARHEQFTQVREKIRIEIVHLEQVRDEILTGKMDPKFIMMEPSKLNESIVELYKQEKEIDYYLKMENEFRVLQKSLNPSKPSFPRLGISLLVGALVGIFMGLIIVFQRGARA